MKLAVAFLWACLIIGVGIAMLGAVELLSQAVQPLSDVMIGEPILEAILEEN